MRARYYDPVCGRFVSQDPGRHGANWFDYTPCSPTNYVDATGREFTIIGITATMDIRQAFTSVAARVNATVYETVKDLAGVLNDEAAMLVRAKEFAQGITSSGEWNYYAIQASRAGGTFLKAWALGCAAQGVHALPTGGRRAVRACDTLHRIGALGRAEGPAASIRELVMLDRDNPPYLIAFFDVYSSSVSEDDIVARCREELDGGVSPDQRDGSGHSALMLAAWSGMPRLVILLCQRGASLNAMDTFVRQEGTGGYSALHYAVVANCVDCVRALLASGADPNIRRSDPDNPLTPLDLYFRPGPSRDPEIAAVLTEYGAQRGQYRWASEQR